MTTAPLYPLGSPDPGDIVQIYAPSAGYPKYHICLSGCTADQAAKFLYINSETTGAFVDDRVFPNSSFPCIPPSPSGTSVVSCSAIVPVNRRQLGLFNARVIGRLDPSVARDLEKFVDGHVKSLRRAQKDFVLAALSLV